MDALVVTGDGEKDEKEGGETERESSEDVSDHCLTEV